MSEELEVGHGEGVTRDIVKITAEWALIKGTIDRLAKLAIDDQDVLRAINEALVIMRGRLEKLEAMVDKIAVGLGVQP